MTAKEPDRDRVVLPVPAVFFTPETGFGGGIGCVYSYRLRPEGDVSKDALLIPAAIYTEKKQTILRLFTQHYPAAGKYFIDTSLAYVDYPDKFYGIGDQTELFDEETFTEQYQSVDLNFYRSLADNLYLGPALRFDHARLVDLGEEGRLAEGSVFGSESLTLRGAGVSLRYSTRDSEFTPQSGRIVEASAVWYDHRLASQATFRGEQLRYREYIGLGRGQKFGLLATDLSYEGATGNVPFRKLGRLGGQYRLRGHFLGRFRDRFLAAVQLGHRYFWTERFGTALFAASGKVGPQVNKLFQRRAITTYGYGIRYLVLKDQKVGFRLDFADGDDETAVYFGVGEAF